MERSLTGVCETEREAVSLACSDRSALILEYKLALAPKELISTSLHELLGKAGHWKRSLL